MTSTSRLYDAMNSFLRQCDMQWRDLRHLKTRALDDGRHYALARMFISMASESTFTVVPSLPNPINADFVASSIMALN